MRIDRDDPGESTMGLNARALERVERILARADELRVHVHEVEGGGRLIDCGVKVPGGLFAGVELARVCLSGLGHVCMARGEVGGRVGPHVQVVTDHPVTACLGSQYAGWEVKAGSFFGMGSGPMRAVRGREDVLTHIGCAERADRVVGVLESGKLPSAEVFQSIAAECGVPASNVTLLVAPTASLAGGVQVVARSIETALHKLHALNFDVSRVVTAYGIAPLPPVAKNDLAAIGRTNDAILYGGRVVLYVQGDDASLEDIGPRVPSSASKDHGEPFAAIFARNNHDFYKVDPHLFSPAELVFENVETGRSHAFGRVEPAILSRSFFS
jgi:methenyltetrahydromethanopterin cyclohydrolase